MMGRKLQKIWLAVAAIILCAGFLPLAYGAEDAWENGLVIQQIPLEGRKIARKQIMLNFIQRYRQNQVFGLIYDYMIAKYAELHRTRAPRPPETVMEESFDNARNLMDYTRKVVGNSLKGIYDPEQVYQKVRHYLWLKGLCFLLLGIGEEHKVAISFFYVPGNEAFKKEFLKDVVLYSYPEIPDVPENQAWLERMMGVMDKLGYEIFNVEKYINADKSESGNKIP
ncbi:MAG: hypothetical protein K6U80_01545 [Firmicutes bacterium]|nr:hypothetical protein [Bacillota bacterium]